MNTYANKHYDPQCNTIPPSTWEVNTHITIHTYNQTQCNTSTQTNHIQQNTIRITQYSAIISALGIQTHPTKHDT